MGQKLTLTAADGFTLGAYRADPTGTPKGALVVIQEIFGVNSHMRDVTDRFAELGYVAIAPAIFDRDTPGMEVGYDDAGRDAGIKARAAIPVEKTLLDLQAAADAVKGIGKIGIVGYCWGGTLAYLAAGKLSGLSAAVGYYGGQIASQFLDVEPQDPGHAAFRRDRPWHSADRGAEDHRPVRGKCRSMSTTPAMASTATSAAATTSPAPSWP